MKLAKTLVISKKQLLASKDEHGQITNNKDVLIKVVEEFYRKLYSSSDRQTEDNTLTIQTRKFTLSRRIKY